jgi:hypothetical protein
MGAPGKPGGGAPGLLLLLGKEQDRSDMDDRRLLTKWKRRTSRAEGHPSACQGSLGEDARKASGEQRATGAPCR